jgi:hypothetical protein
MKKILGFLALGFFLALAPAHAQQTATQSLTLTVSAAPLTISNTTLPYGITTVSYSGTVVVTGGVTPYTFSVSSGSLPTGLTLNTATGVVSGTPTVVGPNSFTIKVTDSQSIPATATQIYSVPVVAKLLISTTSLPSAVVSQAYTGVINFTGGVGPYTCSVATGTLPSWATLALAGNTCVVSGTPTVTSSTTFTIQVGSAQ